MKLSNSKFKRFMKSAFFLSTSVNRLDVVLSSSYPTLDCPVSGFEEVPSGTTVRLGLSSKDKLCTLTQSNVDGEEIQPVGRSYDGHEWEAVAGPYRTMGYNCDDTSCEVTLPQLNDNNQRFQLRGFERSLSGKDTAARFFEQATFGTTEEDLKSFENEDEDTPLMSYFANWTYHQIHHEGMTSHRNFWRERTMSHFKQLYGREGKAPKPCEKGSHWRGYTFAETDKKKYVEIDFKDNSYFFTVDGQLRTVASSFQLKDSTIDSFPLTLRICWVEPHISGLVTLRYNDKCRVLEGGNPIIEIDQSTDFLSTVDDTDIAEEVMYQDQIERMVLDSMVESDSCTSLEGSVFIKVNHGNNQYHLLYEPRLKLKQNTLRHPIYDGGGSLTSEPDGDVVQCSNVPRTYLNENSCRLSTSQNTCAPTEFSEGTVRLNASNVKKFFEGAKKYVYAVTNLRIEDDYKVESPCESGVRSRWKRINAEICSETVHSKTASIFATLIENDTDTNPHLRDLYLPSGKTCHWDDRSSVEMTVIVGIQCWKTVHPDYFNVYDFTDWSQKHPGNNVNKQAIKQFANKGSHLLEYPISHSMPRWRSKKKEFGYVGRLGDNVDFKDFPDTLRSPRIAELFELVVPIAQNGRKAIVCGSPFEGKSKLHSSSFSITRRPELDFLQPHQFDQQKRTVWTVIATSASDQLRQRVAWALSQLLVVSPSSIKFPFQTESFLTYYDIFVRNAFKNYRQILKEVAYSPMMGEMLSYLGSRSKEYVWKETKEINFADENFAREVMQLFSIGLVELHSDGTPVLDSNDETISTYNNDDIQEYARVWTGFHRQNQRGNIEERGINMNTIDPMGIHIKWRDQLPKMGLDGKYIGDAFPICSELPPDSFLKQGAKFRLLGKGKKSDIQHIPTDAIPLALDASSLLYQVLCDEDEDGNCSFPAVVNLSNDLDCDGEECELSHLKIVNVGNDIHYEYVRPPCVHLTFSENETQYIIVDKDGKVALERNDPKGETILNSFTYFRVEWSGGRYPNIDNSCGDGTCQEVFNRCRCDTAVEQSRVFSSAPTRDEILSQLNIGALAPNMYEYDGMQHYNDFTLHFKNTAQRFGRNSAFEIDDDFGNKRLLKNLKSSVVLTKWDQAEYSSFEFRNPVSFYDESPEVKDAQYETDAAIDQYFYHKNTGPFLALRFIQRFGISNPSPSFVERVSNAFRTGSYLINSGSNSFSFGSNKYGDLSSMFAAIILDKESRAIVLDADPTFGGMREPLMKVTSLLRGMKYVETNRNLLSLHGLEAKLGQSPHDLPSVFSFFLPEYSPPGVISKASLVAPEGMILQNSISYANGLISLIKYGLNSCSGGFGGQKRCWKEVSDGHLSYLPKEPDNETQVVNNLASILTSGRLSTYHRDLIEEIYSNQHDKTEALKLAQQLIMLSPEFSTLGITRGTQEKRPKIASPVKTCQKYKAVVHILLKGGCDSFNLLVPHSRCGNKDMYEEYRNVRGSVGIPKADLLTIDAEDSNQVCDTFGIHPNLPIIRDLYDADDVAFLAGIGILSAPVTKENYGFKTKTQLFAHNTIQAEIGRLDPYVSSGGNTGTLGRLADALSTKYSVNAFAIDTSLVALEGTKSGTPKTAVNSAIGFQKFNPSAINDDTINSEMQWINGDHEVNSNFFSQTWSSSLHESIVFSERLHNAENSVKSNSTFPSSKFGQQLELIAKVIASNECRGSSRDIFYVETGSFDHHADVLNRLEDEFDRLNDGLTSFVDEIKSLPNDIWEKVTIVVSSDFGRTMSGNSGDGTDHGWGGINFMLGGSVKGGKILGSYPDDLTVNNELDIGRGRFIPTMPFEAPWNAVSQWLGIEEEYELEKILPNRNSFPDMLLESDETFVDEAFVEENCEGEGTVVYCSPTEIVEDDDYYFEDDSTGDDDNIVDSSNESSNKSTIIIATTIPILLLIFGLIAGSFYFRNKSKQKYKYFDDESEEKDKTFDLGDMSFEEQVQSVNLYHYKNDEGVEIAANKSLESLT